MLERGLRYVMRTGIRRGMGGSRGWMTAAILAGGVRGLRRLARTEPEVLYRTTIRPGERFVITSRRPE